MGRWNLVGTVSAALIAGGVGAYFMPEYAPDRKDFVLDGQVLREQYEPQRGWAAPSTYTLVVKGTDGKERAVAVSGRTYHASLQHASLHALLEPGDQVRIHFRDIPSQYFDALLQSQILSVDGEQVEKVSQ